MHITENPAHGKSNKHEQGPCPSLAQEVREVSYPEELHANPVYVPGMLAGAGYTFHNVTVPLLNTFFSLFRVRHAWIPAYKFGFMSRKDKQ